VTDPRPDVEVPTVLNPEAIGDPNRSPVVQLPPWLADSIRREQARRALREGTVTP
jgi:hypothetical protein